MASLMARVRSSSLHAGALGSFPSPQFPLSSPSRRPPFPLPPRRHESLSRDPHSEAALHPVVVSCHS